MAAPDPSTYFRKGFGLKAQVQDELAADYSGRLVDRMKADQAHAAEENQRLSRELDALRARVAAGDALGEELTALRGERDAIRARVTDMLEQLEGLNL